MRESAVGGRLPGVDLWLLTRCRATQLRNLIDQQLRDAPGRTFFVLALLVAIWVTLYLVLWKVFQHVHSWGLVGVVADEHLFAHFFLVLAVMLAFSNAILTFSTLYGREEAGFLLGTPLRARDVVFVKWLEGILLSSWSFLLLGVPLMLAIARTAPVQWYYYPLFLGHFLGFVAIPACLGLLAAWVVAMWAPRRPLTVGIGAAAIVILTVIYWLSSISDKALEAEEWLRVVFRQIAIVEQPWFPSTWTAKGIVGAVRQHVGESLFYLIVVLGNGAFLSWLTINLLGHFWPESYSRAQQGRYQPTIRRGWLTAAVCWTLFFYLPGQLRRIMLKDLRGFARDAKQWSQMLIMFGLLVIYVLNLRRMPVDLNDAHIKGLIAFLNLTTVSLILATFTSRFIYPLLSLESQQLWLIGLLPVRRRTLLLVKFLFAVTVTGLSAGVVMGLAVRVLNLPSAWAWLNILVCLGVCVGLSGLSIGLGARFPVLGNRNPARIASSFGGTLNLIASMALVGIIVTGVGVLSFQEMSLGRTFGALSASGWLLLVGCVAFGGLVATGALWVGARHFERLEA
jgi:ABC-2 type transport system permease protein